MAVLTKGKGHTVSYLDRHRWKVEVELQTIHIPSLEGGWWSPFCGCCTPGEDPISILREAGWDKIITP